MADVDSVIEDIVLMHAENRFYDPVKRREYYLKTRKLKGRVVGKAKSLADKAWETDKEYDAKVRKAGEKFARERDAGRAAREERIEMQQQKARAARTKVSKMKDPKKKKRAEIKLDALERKLNKARNKVLNARDKVVETDRKINRGVNQARENLKKNTDFRNVRVKKSEPKYEFDFKNPTRGIRRKKS